LKLEELLRCSVAIFEEVASKQIWYATDNNVFVTEVMISFGGESSLETV
jgi:hypothetical protein